MKNLIQRLLLLAAGILCLSCGAPTQDGAITKEKIETLRTALKAVSEKFEPITVEASFDEAEELIQNLKPQETGLDPDTNLRFRYDDKWFVHKDDGPGKESSYILYEESKTKVVLFVPKSKKK